MESNKKLQRQDIEDLSRKLEEEEKRRKTTEERLKRILIRKRKGYNIVSFFIPQPRALSDQNIFL